MAFDFSKLSKGEAISSITDPAALFDALPNKADGYGYLRAVQKTVLDAWSDRRKERDLVIKTNTGGGKTIAGLLILQTCLNEGSSPALYVAPDPHLAERVIQEAEQLGIVVVDNPENGKFLSGLAICVTTMQVLVNGKTRFGLVGPGGRQPISVRAVVVDDAHAALALTEEKTQLKIPSAHDCYRELLELFEDDLKNQSLNTYLDIVEDDNSAVLRIPFWNWRNKQPQVLSILRPHRTEPAFEWAWPLMSDLLPLCQAVVTSAAIEIMPPCPPIEKIPSFAEADRRIYLTATLADDSVLVTHFDAHPESVATSIVPDSAADLGDRLVLAPQDLNPAINDAEVRAAMRLLADDYNVVVLTPSHRQAATWSDEADQTVSKSVEISSVVEELKADHVGLVVIVNRYDGIDLPDKACRVLVLDGLPQAYSGIERREAVALRDSEAMVTRQLQRLEQGMGRGVRSRDDRCAVVILGRRLTQLVARSDVADRLSPATRAQLDLSRKVAQDLEGTKMSNLLGVVRQLVEGDSGFRTVSREALVGVTYGPAKLSPTASHLRQAYNCAASGRLDQARDNAQTAVNLAADANDDRLAGWLGEALADYIHPLDAVDAQKALTAASKRNPAVLRPLAGVSYKKIKPGDAQPKQASASLQQRYTTGHELLLGIEALLSDLVWDNDRTNATEAALAELAEHLGFVAQRPEQDFGRGPDVLWALGDNKYAVVEAKSGRSGDSIWKKEINQLAGSVNWCTAEYGDNVTVVPLLMHLGSTIEHSGTAPPQTRILNDEKLQLLKAAVRAYATALSSNDGFRDETKVREQLAQHKLTSSTLPSAFTVTVRRQT